MTVRTLDSDLAPLQLVGGSYFRLEAISPTTGAAITGVTVSNIAIYGKDLSDEPLELGSGPYLLVPAAEETP